MGVFLTMGVDGISVTDAVLKRFSITSHGSNIYTPEAVRNVLCLAETFEVAMALIDGVLSSAYRSKVVNAAVGGVYNSKHLEGLALDIKSRTKSNRESFGLLAAKAKSRELGCVRKIIQEPTWIHIDWHRPPWNEEPAVELYRVVDGKYFKVSLDEV